MKVTGRDVRVFALGILAYLIFESISNWEESKIAFLSGYYGVN
ncbi:hypothetical protein [Flavobacterium hiemivividum]|nr:hypothetical protein [Flavobacterium hiemivividum]